MPSFTGSTLVDLPVPCTFDFNVAATKYFDGLTDGEVPVCLQFSGTVFYASPEGGLQVAPISWDKEARFKVPVKSLARHDGVVLSQQRVAVPAQRCSSTACISTRLVHGIPTWEEVLESIIPVEETVV